MSLTLVARYKQKQETESHARLTAGREHVDGVLLMDWSQWSDGHIGSGWRKEERI